MTHVATLLLLTACSSPPEPSTWVDEVYGDTQDRRARMMDVLDDLVRGTRGRLPGSEGDATARTAVVERFASLELQPWGDTYEQRFVDAQGRETANVLGLVRGADPDLADEIVVVGAHHDHLGDGFPGANDNASGVAALLELARDIADDPPARTVLFATWGSEESGFEGSRYFASQPGALDDIVYVVNLDMVGTLRQAGFVRALGGRTGTPGRRWVEEAAMAWPGRTARPFWYSRRSDNASFCEQGVPYVFFWTPDPECYHQACDTVDRIDPHGLVAVTSLARDVTRAAADTHVDLSAAVDAGVDVCRRLPKE
jgi:hypothetical protein